MYANDPFFSQKKIVQDDEKQVIGIMHIARKRNFQSTVNGIVQQNPYQQNLNFPVWMQALMATECPGFDINAYTVPSYGSRPEGVSAYNSTIIQFNRHPMCMCMRELMTIPFVGYKCHKHNGVLYCVSDDVLYVSCMKLDCQQYLQTHRESFWKKGHSRQITDVSTDEIQTNYINMCNSKDGKRTWLRLTSDTVIPYLKWIENKNY